MSREKLNIEGLNEAIKKFPKVCPVTDDMHITREGVSRVVMLDRYSFRDLKKETLAVGDLVTLITKHDPKFPSTGIGYIVEINGNTVKVEVEEEFRGSLSGDEAGKSVIDRPIEDVEKPLEIFWEQICDRNARGLVNLPKDHPDYESTLKEMKFLFDNELFILAGRVLKGAGSDTDLTLFNCYVMPFIHDSREGLAEHRKKVMEIMSRGGGVGTNGSTLRPKHALAKGVEGRSSGAVGWLDDLSKLTNLVIQGGSRRGAQMIMLADWHPDIVEFIVSKMQNPRILRFLEQEIDNDHIREEISKKLKFTKLTDDQVHMYQQIVDLSKLFTPKMVEEAKIKLQDGGTYEVINPDFLTGANISVCITEDLMRAVEEDSDHEFKFPDIDNYSVEEKAIYNEKWHEVGDVREWERMGHGVKVHRKIKAKDLWNLINICSTYSAEPGIFFIDNANDKTNAVAYGQKVVATNPCKVVHCMAS